MTRRWMEEYGLLVFNNGYRIVAILPGKKAVIDDDWQQFGHQQTQADIDLLVRNRPTWGIGITTAWTPAIDIDVRNPVVAIQLEHLAFKMLGMAPVRIGMPPKRLLLFQTDEPFRKINGAEFVMPGEDPTAPGYKSHHIEVLGDGQQCVAYGIHPDTRLPYSWYDWPSAGPLDTRRSDLPMLTEDQARRYLDARAIA